MNPVIGRETSIEVGGKRYVLARCDRGILDQFVKWAETVLPHPLDAIKDKLKDFPPKLQEIMVKDAMDRAALRKTLNSPEVNSLLESTEGITKLMVLLLQKHNPTLTDKEAGRLIDEAEEEHGLAYLGERIATAQGALPTPASETQRQALIEAGLIEADPEKKG